MVVAALWRPCLRWEAGKGLRKGFLNIPGGFREEHLSAEAVAQAVSWITFPAGSPSTLTLANDPQEAHHPGDLSRVLRREGYVGPPLRARILVDYLASGVHQCIVVVEFAPEHPERYSYADLSAWLDRSRIKPEHADELIDFRMTPTVKLSTDVERWAFPIFHDVVFNPTYQQMYLFVVSR